MKNYSSINISSFVLGMLQNRKFNFDCLLELKDVVESIKNKAYSADSDNTFNLSLYEKNLLIRISRKATMDNDPVDYVIDRITKFVILELMRKHGFDYGGGAPIAPIDLIKGKRREQIFLFTRYIIYALSTNCINKKHLSKTEFLTKIGAKFNRDRATVLHGINKLYEFPKLKHIYDALEKTYRENYFYLNTTY